MAHIPGYSSMTDTSVSYPSTYNDARNSTFNAAAASIAGGMAYASMQDSPQGRGNRGRGRGRGGGRFPRSDRPKVFTCANKHPIQALKDLRQDAKFEVICQYLTNGGAAIVVTTTIDGVVYQGEGTNSQIARTIAAQKALIGMNAAGHELLALNVNLAEQKKLVMERITTWQEEQANREAKKVETQRIKSERKAQQPAPKKVKDNNGNPAEVANNPNNLTYGTLIHRYGPDIVENTVELEDMSPDGCHTFKCTLLIQGFEFDATGPTKKSARNEAVTKAFDQFIQTPPPVVNEKKTRKYPKGHRRSGDDDYKPIEPVEVQDKIAKKCWEFVSEQISGFDENHKSRRNLVCIVKVEGELNEDNCEVVAWGSGTLVIKKDKMTPDGTCINDSTGESLALRALRRYLLDQIELCQARQNSIYVKDKSGGKCSMRKNVKLIMYTNSSPMGDCRYFNSNLLYGKPIADTPATPAADAAAPASLAPDAPQIKTEPTETPMEVETPAPPKRIPFFMRRRNFKEFKEEDIGKIQIFPVTDAKGKDEVPQLPNETSHCIVSPSDKLAMRQIAGVQGSVLFSLSQPVYLSQYLINRTFNEESTSRAIYGRVKDTKIPNGPEAPPTFTKVLWKATFREERRTPFSMVWAKSHDVEIIYAAQGKQFHPPQDGVEATPENVENFLAVSEYCTKSLYTAYVNVCKKFKKSYPQKYSVAKYANTRYRQIKNGIISHIKESGLGEWPERTCKPDY